MKLQEQGAQLVCAERRVATEPHKRRAVPAGTAVGAAVGEGGKPSAGDEGSWSLVMSRRAQRQERAWLDDSACRAHAPSSGARRWRRARRRPGARREDHK
eukprot:6679634-Prymnesium_polylepis.1